MAVVARRQAYNRTEVRQAILRAFGGYVESITSADTTSILCDTMEYRLGSDARGKGMGVYLPDQADNAESRWQVTSWDDSLGDATVDTMGETPGAGETVEFYLRGDPGPDDINTAINEVMRQHERMVYTAIPTRDFDRLYDLSNYDWIERAGQIRAVFRRQSPNLLTNPSFETWGSGAGPGLAEWVLTGTSSTVTRADGRRGGYSARLQRSSNDAQLRQDLTWVLEDLKGTYGATAYTSPLTVTFGAWCKSSTAAMAHVQLDDGTTTATSSKHSGGGTWEFLSQSITLATTSDNLYADLECVDNDGTADWDDAWYIEGSSLEDDDVQYGEQRYRLIPTPYNVTLEGTRPSIRLPSPIPRGEQLVVATHQPYFTLTADADVTDMPLEAATAFTIENLLDKIDPGKEQTRYDRMRFRWIPKARHWARELAPLTAPYAQAQTVVMGL